MSRARDEFEAIAREADDLAETVEREAARRGWAPSVECELILRRMDASRARREIERR